VGQIGYGECKAKTVLCLGHGRGAQARSPDRSGDPSGPQALSVGEHSPSPALHSIIADAVIFAERIMQRIDAAWPIPR